MLVISKSFAFGYYYILVNPSGLISSYQSAHMRACVLIHDVGSGSDIIKSTNY